MRMHRPILAAALILASAAALATTTPSDPKKDGMNMDMKSCQMMHGGKMTPEEHRKMADQMFKTLDANADGTISRAEFDSHHEDMMKMHMSGHDSGAGHEQHH